MSIGEARYDNGENLFAKGEMIYINRCVEQIQSHVHAHDFIEIAYVASGRGIHIIGDKEYEVSKGDLFVINFDVLHEFRSDPSFNEGMLVIYNCVFRPQFLDQSLINSRCFSDITHVFLLNSLFEEETSGNNICLCGQNIPELQELYEKMYLEYSTKKFGYIEMLRAYLLQLLVLIFRTYRSNETEEQNAREKGYFDNAIHFMKQHYNQDIKLEELAAMSFLSRNYFCSSFKKSTGMTVLEYIQSLRINEACSMLRESDARIADIAQSVGYSNLKFFNQLFKKIAGKTPSEYRKTVRTV